MTAVCCNQCYNLIADKNVPSANLWLDLCSHFVKFEGVFKLRETRVPGLIKHFRDLEELGFLTTADGDDAVKVRVNGYDIVDKEEIEMCLETFCIHRGEHETQWM